MPEFLHCATGPENGQCFFLPLRKGYMVAASENPDIFFCLGHSLAVAMEGDAQAELVVLDALDFLLLCVNL